MNFGNDFQAHFRHTKWSKTVCFLCALLVLVLKVCYNKYIKNLEKQGFFEHFLLCVQRPKNRSVVGSSPTGGARKARKHSAFGLSILQPHDFCTCINYFFRRCKRKKAVILGYCLPEKSTIKYALGLHWQKSR